MVRMQGPDEYERLDEIVHRVAKAHDLVVETTGWTRKTYDLVWFERRTDVRTIVARIESFATTNGEVLLLDDKALPFAKALACELESAFAIGEAVIKRA